MLQFKTVDIQSEDGKSQAELLERTGWKLSAKGYFKDVPTFTAQDIEKELEAMAKDEAYLNESLDLFIYEELTSISPKFEQWALNATPQEILNTFKDLYFVGVHNPTATRAAMLELFERTPIKWDDTSYQHDTTDSISAKIDGFSVQIYLPSVANKDWQLVVSDSNAEPLDWKEYATLDEIIENVMNFEHLVNDLIAKLDFCEALKKFEEATRKLAIIWNEAPDNLAQAAAEGYPEDMPDFNEFSQDVSKWTETAIIQINNEA